MIPESPELKGAFAALTIGEYAKLPHGQKVVACQVVDRTDVDGPAGSQPEIGIAYHKPTTVSLDSLIACVERELKSPGHALFVVEFRKKSAIAAKVLGLAVACSSSLDQVRPTLQTIVDSTSSSNLNQFAVLKVPPGDEGIYTFSDFSYGRLNLNRMDYVCQQAGSDYFRRYGAHLKNCTAQFRAPAGSNTLA